MPVIGADIVQAKLSRLPAAIKAKVDAATAKSGRELITLAKVLIPVGSDVHKDGRERDKIEGTANPDGSFLCDFGPKAKVIEEHRPFVNPALAVTRKKHKARAKRALGQAVKAVFNG